MHRDIIFACVIIYLFLPFSDLFAIFVDTCPRNNQSWTRRSRTFLCSNPGDVYHCIQTLGDNLIETCMRAFIINSDKVGCPWVKIHNGKAYLGNPFIPCDPLQSGCPNITHERYSTDSLYIYPSCITSTIITASNSTGSVKRKSTVTTLISRSASDCAIETPWILTSCLLVIVLVLVFSLIIYLRRMAGQKSLDETNRKSNCKDVLNRFCNLHLQNIPSSERQESESMVAGKINEDKISVQEKKKGICKVTLHQTVAEV